MFKHFVITRFNLRFIEYDKDKQGNLIQTETWLKKRFDLFEMFCFPSLKGQSCKDFIWFVLFDVNTPPEYKNRIKILQNDFSCFFPLFLEAGDKECVHSALIKAINSMTDENIKYIITTRIDNDDSFHKDMIKDTRKFYEMNTAESFLNFNYGIQYDLMNQFAVHMFYQNNHFISRLEKNNNLLETVLIYDHTQIDKIKDVNYINNKKKPMWVEVVHDTNLSNWMKTSYPVFSKDYFKQFNISVSLDSKRSYEELYHYLTSKLYQGLSFFFSKIGLFREFKKIIKLFKKISE